MAPFYGWGSTAARLEPLRGGSLLFTTKFPVGALTHQTHIFEYIRRFYKSLFKNANKKTAAEISVRSIFQNSLEDKKSSVRKI